MKKNVGVGIIVIIIVTIIIGVVLWHPWINQQAVDNYMDAYIEENYPELIGDVKATLTDWEPFGHHFIVEMRVMSEWVKVGNGFVDILGKVTDLHLELT